VKNFEYIKPTSLADTIFAFEKNEDAFLLAGGTDLLVGMKHGLIKPGCIIDIKDIPDINTFEYKNGWKFGTLTTIRDIEVSKILGEKMPFLCQAAEALGTIQVRNRATVGGNLCNASPCANFGTAFLALDSQLKIISRDGERMVALEDFFTGPNTSILKKGEVLTEILVPREITESKGIFLKHCTGKSNDIGLVNITILLDIDSSNSLCKDIRIAMGAVAPTPIRAKQAEKFLNGKVLHPDLIAETAELASSQAAPITDFRARAGYRKDLLKTMVVKGINLLLAQA
jgi:carbon-monoxide dehydrogenase medium subunit